MATEKLAAGEDARQSPRDLSGLRIDRGARPAPPPRGRPPLWLVLPLAAVLAAAAIPLYRATLGRLPRVEVVYAAAGGAAAAGAPVLTGSGYVVTHEKYIHVGVKVAGRVDAFTVEEGDTVRRGDVLARLDSRDYVANLQRAEATRALARANLDLARTQLARARDLHARGILADQERDVAENAARVAAATLAQAAAEVAAAAVSVEYTTLRAPTDGVVLAKLKEIGEIAVPGGFQGAGDVVRLANLEELRAEIDVNEVDFRRVEMGQRVEVVPDAYPDRRYGGAVVKIYPQANRQKGTLRVEVKIENPDDRLRPDMTVRLTFLAAAPAAGRRPPVVLPRAALRGAEAPFVWVVTGGRLRRQAVVLADDVGDRVAIASGLDGGEAVVVSPDEGLREGLRVVVAAP